MAAGALGVPLGSWLAQRLRPRYADCDPLICGFALLASAPVIFFALVAVDVNVGFAYCLIFVGMTTLNLTWSIVADIILVSAFCLYRARECVIFKKLLYFCDHLIINMTQCGHIAGTRLACSSTHASYLKQKSITGSN